MSTDCNQTIIFLFTQARVSNTDQIVQLVASNSYMNRRLHTFGVSRNANETLIKKCAAKGFGNFYFIEEKSEME